MSIPPAPDKPIKPRLHPDANSKAVLEYSSTLGQYEKDLLTYQNAKEEYQKEINELNELLVEYIKEESGLKNIPEKHQSKVWQYAYDQGHSNGYGEEAKILDELIDIFN